MEIRKLLPRVKENVFLADYSTFKIGGPARYFYIAKTIEDLIKAVGAAQKCRMPFFILGGGSNILVSDKGFSGLVIKIKNSPARAGSRKMREKLKIQRQNSPYQNKFGTGQAKFKIFCEAGISLASLVSKSLSVGATGLEWAVGIPGTVGGAIRGNAGAFGGSMGDIVEKVAAIEVKNKKAEIKDYTKKDCRFGYRKTTFQQKKNLIILSCEIELRGGNKKIILEKIKKNLKKRKETQPLNFPSAGSVFKNPRGLSAGKLIEECGLKNKKIGGAQISRKHANFILNCGNAKAEDIKKLIDLIKKKVKNKFGITLKEEICYLGFPK